MSLQNGRDGKPPHVIAGNGVPLGPRVKRAGWRGWFLVGPGGALVPDGHVEPLDPAIFRPRPKKRRKACKGRI